jgi:hypothetical protein
MPPPVRPPTPDQNPSIKDLPYGPLPARSDNPIGAQPRSPDLDQVLGFSRFEPQTPDTSPGAEGHPPNAAQAADHDPTGEDEPDASSELEIAAARGDADDDVHFGVAAKALGVSRKTVERMVKRGLLERGPSGVPATVSKRGLVTALEQRRRDVSHLTRATEVERAQSGYASLTAAWPDDAISELQEFLRPVLEPLLAEFVDARTRAAVLESQMERITERAEQERGRDELLLVLATGGWRQRRRARRAALRHYVLRDDLSRRRP